MTDCVSERANNETTEQRLKGNGSNEVVDVRVPCHCSLRLCAIRVLKHLCCDQGSLQGHTKSCMLHGLSIAAAMWAIQTRGCMGLQGAFIALSPL